MLDVIQKSGIFPDSKEFVDMVGTRKEEEILTRFELLGDDIDSIKLLEFISQNFKMPAAALLPVAPIDWKENPHFIKRIKDDKMKEFARIIHYKWKALLRRVNPSKVCPECASSALELPYPFVIPGGRFRELYYWDAFWILEGLFVSEMCQTASMILKNFRWLIEKYGFIPNGSRIYYLNRSQPAFFIQMLKKFMDNCIKEDQKSKWIESFINSAESEYSFWMERKIIHLENEDNSCTLSRYEAETQDPRPESYFEDTNLAALLPDKEKGNLYKNIASAAESGWDFSIRWMDEPPKLQSTATSKVVPVDLNSLMWSNESILSEFHSLLGNDNESQKFSILANDRRNCIEKWLWNGTDWSDLFLKESGEPEIPMAHRTWVISNLSPLFFDLPIELNAEMEKHVKERIGQLEHIGGVANNNNQTGEQWDYPNVWAPIQYQVISLCKRLSEIKNIQNGTYWRQKSITLANKFISSTYCGYVKYGQFFEKYRADTIGDPGGGGEYYVQEGFGWTNGVILWILKNFADEIEIPAECQTIEKHGKKAAYRKLLRSDIAFRKQIRINYLKDLCNNYCIEMLVIMLALIVIVLHILSRNKSLFQDKNVITEYNVLSN